MHHLNPYYFKDLFYSFISFNSTYLTIINNYIYINIYLFLKNFYILNLIFLFKIIKMLIIMGILNNKIIIYSYIIFIFHLITIFIFIYFFNFLHITSINFLGYYLIFKFIRKIITFSINITRFIMFTI